MSCQAYKGSVDGMFQSVLAFGELLEMILQVAQGIGYTWGGVCRQRYLFLEQSDQRVGVYQQRMTKEWLSTVRGYS